jgi:hypothetical protein
MEGLNRYQLSIYEVEWPQKGFFDDCEEPSVSVTGNPLKELGKYLLQHAVGCCKWAWQGRPLHCGGRRGIQQTDTWAFYGTRPQTELVWGLCSFFTHGCYLSYFRNPHAHDATDILCSSRNEPLHVLQLVLLTLNPTNYTDRRVNVAVNAEVAPDLLQGHDFTWPLASSPRSERFA